MTFHVGQAVWTDALYYTDGTPTIKVRPYLIVKSDERHIYTLDVSTTAGKSKEWTTGARVHRLMRFDPPFPKKSFVKLDSLTCVPVSVARGWKMINRNPLDKEEMAQILRLMDEGRFWQIHQ